MRTVLTFTQRCIRLFLRDKATVFFSFLSTIILIALYFLFIGKSYADGMSGAFGSHFPSDSIYAMVYIQMIAGVLVLNSLSLSIGAFSIIAHDFESRRVDSFLLTPVKPFSLLLSYFAGGFVISLVLNIFTWVLSVLLIGLAFGYWVSLSVMLPVFVVLLFASIVSCSLMLLFTAIVKSSAAIGTFSGVSGTFFGFLCGIYMPYEMLGEGVKTMGSVLPLTHSTIWLKQIVLQDAFVKLDAATEFHSMLLDVFSAQNIGITGLDIPLWGTLLYTAAIALLCLVCAGRIISRKLRVR